MAADGEQKKDDREREREAKGGHFNLDVLLSLLLLLQCFWKFIEKLNR